MCKFLQKKFLLALTYLLYTARTKYDIIIDESSNKPREQIFEKMIAGLYLGEIFRLVLTEMIDTGDLFSRQDTNKLEKEYALDTSFLSLMER
jgi:hexokinase